MRRDEYMAHLIKLAEDNVCHGVLEEPRGFFDTITITGDGNIVRGNPDVFRNGEQFPVRLTHMTVAARSLESDLVTAAAETAVQNVGLRLIFHDQYYMAPVFAPVPIFQNVINGGSIAVSQAQASWRFARPFILSARDTMNVAVALEEDPGADERRVAVAFTGVGMLSRRPYFIESDATIGDLNQVILPTDNFRTDGSEPVIITDMTVNCSGLLTALEPLGDIRQVRVQIRQVGNGTNADWFTGPIGITPPLPQCPAVLLGILTGRCVAHELPGDGILWEPGEGLDVEMVELPNVDAAGVRMAIGFFGYVSVT